MKNKIELFKDQHPSTSFLVGDNLTFNKAMDSLIDNSMDGLPCDMVKVAPVWHPLTLISRMEIYLKSKTEPSGGDVITQPIVNTNLTISKWYNGKPKVYIMSAGKQYENIVIGHENNIWGGNPNSINSHKNVNEGDIIITYCSDKENKLQGFHTIGKIISKDDSYYFDKSTWGKPYCGIVHIDWFNKPNKDCFFSLEDTKPLINYLDWGWTLRTSTYADMSIRGWDVDSQVFRALLNKLTNY